MVVSLMIPGILLEIQLQNTVSDKVGPANANCSSYYSIGGVAILSTEKTLDKHLE